MAADLRKSTRRKVSQTVLMITHDGAIIGQCKMTDVSAGGAKLQLESEVDIPSEFTLLLSKLDPRARRNCTLAWREPLSIGVRFTQLAEPVTEVA